MSLTYLPMEKVREAYKVDLTRGVREVELPFLLVQKDQLAHQIVCDCYNGTEKAQIDTYTAYAYASPTKGVNVILPCQFDVANGCVVVTLNEEATMKTGLLQIYIGLEDHYGTQRKILIVKAIVSDDITREVFIDPDNITDNDTMIRREAMRVQAEDARQQQEFIRKENEEIRITKQEERRKAENLRAEFYNDTIKQEALRVAAETERQLNEGERQDNELTRQKLYDDMLQLQEELQFRGITKAAQEAADAADRAVAEMYDAVRRGAFKGDKGDTPVRGIDYWTSSDRAAVQQATDSANTAALNARNQTIECNAATTNAKTAAADCVKVTSEVKGSVIIANNAALNAEAAANQVAVFLSGLEGKKLVFSGDGIVRWSNA